MEPIAVGSCEVPKSLPQSPDSPRNLAAARFSVRIGDREPVMALFRGARLGPYEILSTLGAGGMGEVYLARDTRLDRTVAVKILPKHLSENPKFHDRFQREARVISSLSH